MRGLFGLAVRGVALGCLLLGLASPAWAVDVVAYFGAGNTTTEVDGYKGMPGDGWTNAWLAGSHSASTFDVRAITSFDGEYDPLDVADGNYLSYTCGHNTNGPKGCVARSFDDGIDLTKDYTLDFKIRIDNDSGTFDTLADQFYIFEDEASITQWKVPTPTASWLIKAVGDQGGLDHNWQLCNGDGLGGYAYVDTGVPLTVGTVVDMSVLVHPATSTWHAVINDGTYSYDNTGGAGLGYQGTTTSGQFKLGGRTYTGDPPVYEQVQLSFDTLKITGDAPPPPPSHPGYVWAHFDDFDETGVDTYAGKAGQGWADAWYAKSYGASTFVVQVDTASPLDATNGMDEYLSVKVGRDTNGPRGMVSRNFGATPANEDGIDLTKQYTVDFKIRVDDDSGTFNYNVDYVWIGEDEADPAAWQVPTETGSWNIMASGPLQGGAPTTNWQLLDGDGLGGFTYVDTGVPMVEGTVVDMKVFVDPTTNTWDAVIDDGTYSYDSSVDYAGTLGYRGTTTSGQIKFMGRTYAELGIYEEIAFSLDALLISQVNIPGDATGDGVVNEFDAQRLATNWGANVDVTWEMGDFDGDGLVGPSDASILAAHWGYGTGGEGNPVPEPSAMAMLLAAALVGLVARRRRK